MMRLTAIIAALLISFPVVALAQGDGISYPASAFMQGYDIYGSGIERIQLIENVSSEERTLGFMMPGASGKIIAVPELQIISVTITAANGWAFDFRYSPLASNPPAFDLGNLSEDARLTYSTVARGASALAGMLAEKPEFAPFRDIFIAIAENRGIVTARRDRTILAVAKYRESERHDAATLIDIDVAGRELHLRQSPLTPEEFDVVIDSPPGSHTEFKISGSPDGITAYVFAPGLPPDRSLESIGDELAVFMHNLLPVLIIASDNNDKISAIHDELAKYAYRASRITDFQKFDGSDYSHSCYDPEPEYSAYIEPSPGYAAYIQDEDVARQVYYYRTSSANGFILQDSFTNYTRLAITASRKIFSPAPYESEKLPVPDYVWEEAYPHAAGDTSICPHCAYRLGGLDLSPRDVFLFEDTGKLFRIALEDDSFRNLIDEDLALGLRKYMSMTGDITKEAQKLPLISLRYREVEGLSNVGVLTYRDADSLYQIAMPPRKGYMNFAFSAENALMPPLWRFYLAPAGDKTQLVISYPVEVPLEYAERMFNRSAGGLSELYSLSKFLARYDSLLADVPPIIDEIRAEHNRVGPKMFIRAGSTELYTDWLTAGFFAGE